MPKSPMDFGDSVRELRVFHQDLEEQFLSINKLIPYNHNSHGVYSPKLYNILQCACVQVIAMMEKLVDELTSSAPLKVSQPHRQKPFNYYFTKLNKNNLLSKLKLCPRLRVEVTTTPLKSSTSPPKWWEDYNESKHYLPQGAYKGTIWNAMNALGALYLLHNIAGPLMKGHAALDILDGRRWHSFSTEFREDYQRLKNSRATSAIIMTADTGGLGNYKSKIYYFVSEFRP